ncbi:gliding motility-associated C-terminal domain-containing protein [Flavobacterium sp. PL02]|uniref:Ig-like domain-containing protein n=1 Tax=Flavobacterium sp. PL02 TaxID=3088354 RepID=UPI002B22279C|nr:gliding motility-associated C-terminal domain-containing protein [Flavobacterium sp. PL02]
MSVTTPNDAFDGSMATYASLTNAVGLLCFAQETLSFSQTAKAGDQIVFYLGTGNGLLDVGLLSNVSVQAKNGAADVGSQVALNSPLLNLQLLPGNAIATVTYTLPGDANGVRIETGGLLSLLVNLRVYEVRLQFAAPTITGGQSQSVCYGQSAALSATPGAGTTLAWYSSATSTTALSNTNTYTTPALTATTTYYVSVSRGVGCESDQRIPVTVNVLNPVLPAIDSSGTAICSSTATQATTLSVISPVPGTTYSWFSTPTGGVAITTGTTYTPTVSAGVTNFYVEASIGACKTATRTPVSVTLTPIPAVATVLTPSVSILTGQNATLSASTSESGVVLDWYDVPTGGTLLLASSNTFTTPILTATKTYYVESRNVAGGCVSATRVPIVVNVSTSSLGGCLDANSQQTAQNGLCLLCSSSNPNNSVDGSSSTAATLSVPVGLVTGWIQQTLQFNNSGQAGDVITVDLEIPTGLLDISALSYISLATYNGATYNNDRVAVNSSLLNIQLLTGNRFKASLTAGSAFDRVEIRLGGLATLLTNLNIYGASYKFKARTITGNTTICSGQTTTLMSSAALGETIKWYDALTGGTLLSSTAAYTTLPLTVNTTYYVEVTRNGCVNSERNPVLVTVNNPVAPTTVVATPLNVCSGESTIITVNSPVAGTTYNWYDESAGGNLVFTGTTYTTPGLTASVTYHVEAVIGSCSSPTRTPVHVNVNPVPSVPTVGSSTVFIQSGQNVTLQVTNPVTDVAYDWYDAPINGNLLSSGTTSYTPSPALIVNKSFYIAARSTTTACTNSTRAVINVVISNSINSCLLANSQVTSKGGTTGCLLCDSTNNGASVDGNNATAANLSIPVGLLGDYIQQMLSFPTTGQTGDIIDVELGIPVGLLDISALSNITLQSFNSGVPNSDQVAISSLLNVQLLGGNRFRASFTAAGPFTSVQIQLSGLATLLTSLDIYEASYRYPNASITGASSPICAGQTTTLTATATGTQTFTWYDVATGGTALATNTNTYTTGSLPGTKTFYLEASRGVTPCLNTNRQAITVTVLPIPTESDITITTPLTATCAGGAVLSPTSTFAGATFKYYTDQSKTQEIITGTTIVAQPGVTFSKDASTGALTISGLNATDAPYKYYVSVLNGGICENIDGALKEVVVNFPAGSALTVTATLAGCAKVNLKDAITNFDTSGNTTYTFFDSSNNPITEVAAGNITVSGDYWIQAQTTGVDCPSVKQKVTVTINQLPTLTAVTSSVVVNLGDSVPLSATSNGTVTWYDPSGNAIPSNNTGALNTVGVFTYTVIASNGTCTNSQTITITVIDPASCDPLLEREYATTQQWGTIVTGTVTNEASAVDGNPQTYSTITTGLGLLGIGTTWQNLQWPGTITQGTPVTIKLGSDYSAVALGQSVTVVGTKRDGLGNPIDIGTLQSISGSLLNLLSGQNSFEYTFVPSDATGPKAYDGIRVQMGSILGVAQNINVYDAYYDKPVTQITCGQGDIEDVFFGVKDLGVGALTATVGVTDPWNIADGDVATYATMFSGAGVLAAAQLTATFRTPSMVGDSLRITISKPGTILNLNLLTGFNIQLYLGNTAVGAPIQNNSSLLSLRLLSGGTIAMTVVAPQTQPYDRVTISLGGVASVLDQLRVHNIDRVTNTKVLGGDINNMVTVCPGSNITLEVPPANCSTYKWYDSPTGGNFLADGQTYTIPATLAAGTYKYYIQPIRYGCAALARGEVTVVVRATTPAAAVASVTINGGNNTIICAEDGKVTLNATLAATPVLTNPIYYWYSFDGTTSQLVPGETTSELKLTGLVPGTYTYYVGVSSDEFCETVSGDRKQVTFTILPTSLPTDIAVNNASICHDTDAVLTPTSTLGSPVFFWYFDANKTQPITDGLVVDNVTYAVSNVGVLTISGLTKLMSPFSYYVAVTSDFTCQNKNGELQVTTVTVIDPATPTTTDDTQDFCLVNTPTVANLQTNETSVIWYNVATGGAALAPTTALANGAYYGAILDPITGCESSVRLLVTVTVTDPATPTTTDDTQDFCLVNAPTVASLQVNETGVVWYSTATGGVALAPTTALASGTYYGAILDPITNCESSVRLLVTVTVTDPATPTTTDDTQDFCLVNAPTVASLQVNETGVVWYSTATGGVALAPTTALASGTYYGAILDPVTNCESSVRLLVTVTVTDPATPTTTDATQDFCLVNAPTVASLQVNETGVVWYSTATGGVALAPTTALANGTYYGAILDPVTNCESSVRLLVTVTVTDPATPTTTDATQDFCLVNAPTVASLQVNETGVVWYSTATGGVALAPTTALASGSYYGATLDPVTNCESSVRLLVTVTVTDPATPTTTDTTQDFCLVNAPTVASLQVNETGVVWYNVATGGTVLAPTTALASGNYYGAILDLVTNCESSVRLLVTVTVTDPATPTTTDATQDFCLVNAPTVASLQVNETGVVWYSTATGGMALAPTTALANGTYYGAILDPVTNCESSVRLLVTVTITDPATPTTTDATQDFCLVNAPTVASLQVNETGVVWYSTATGGIALAPTTALANGTYYGAILDPITNCESSVRLLVTVTVTDPATPTTTDDTQDFCLVNAPTVASLQVNETGVVWYSTATGGVALAPTTALASGTYYGAILDPVTNCESSVRLLVTVTITDPATPTTTDTTQDFCLVNAPTVASLQVNETGVVWYSTATGGIALAPTTALANGTYYGVILDPITNCESSVRLLVTVTVTDPATPTTTDDTQDFCLVNAPTVASLQVNETGVVWYSTATGGVALAPTTALANGTYYGAILDPVTNCESSVRLLVTVTVTDPATPTTTDTTQDFCLVNAPTVASLQVNETGVVWYSTATGGVALAPTTALASGTYYGAILDPVTNCESSVRLLVTVTVTDPATPTTTDDTQDFCLVNTPTVANLQVNETGVVWYNVATGGTALAPTTALVSGTYYGAILDPVTGCESSVRLLVTVTVTDPATPTTTDDTQDFCLVNAPTVASLQVNETGVVWYNVATGGTALAPTTALANGTYYGAILDPITNCESSVRLLVTVTITDPATPTTTDTTQDFCLVNAPTVASLQVNETGVVWYNTATGGVALAPTTALASGTYYGAILDPVTNCESSVRLLVTVTVTDPATPTTTDTTQDFCLVNAPTVASLQVNETGVVWYNVATGGTALAPTTALASGTYYGAILDPITNCESSVRLLVTVTVTAPATPTTTDTTQDFCLINAPTVASLQVNETGVVWYSTATGGVALAPTTVLANGTYYGAILDPVANCESSVRLLVTVTVTDPATPTTTDATQDFCFANAPTVASLQVNEANVVWYTTATSGIALTRTTVLANGTYYGVIHDPTTNCESSVRLLVTVTVTDPATPTTNNATQSFCLTNAPTVASLQVNETGVVWYNVATGGTPLAPGTLLVAGTYYGALKDATTGCESSLRLSVQVNFTGNDPVTITPSKAAPCVFDDITYTTASGMSNYNWTITGGGTITAGGLATDNFVTVSWPAIGPASVSVSYSNQCNETNSKLLTLAVATCSDITMSKTVDNPTPNINDKVTFTVTVNNVGSGDFIDTIVSEILPTGYDFISAQTTTGTYSNITGAWNIPVLNANESAVLTVVVQVLPTGNYLNVATVVISNPIDSDTTNNHGEASVTPVCLVVYNEFTPNNDGANDVFKIDCIENYPNNSLNVYNRYGSLVYKQDHYNNDWDGIANVSGAINKGDKLPAGTYYYVLDIGADGVVKTGWLSIIR